MVDIARPEYGTVWASEGEKLTPAQEKIELGWVQEMMPFQWENFLQARQDEAIIYLLQKGIPEYSPTQEYIAQKSVVLYQGAVYLATQTVTGILPSVPASWKRVSTISDSAGVVTVAGGGTGATSAAQARTNLGLGSASLLDADVVVQKDSNGDFSAGVITASLAGNASSADKLKTPRQISLSGSVTSSAVPFDGSSNLVIPVTSVDASGLTSGTVPVERLDNAVTKTSSTGFARLPAGSSTERGTPEQAGFRFNTTLNVPEYYDGSMWQATTATRSDLLGGYRFETTIWAGKAENLPEGFVQCSGQQLLDLAFPTVRADVVASQLFCTEAEWQADPYKRVTHWSLGDGDETTGSWMRCPDKNGVQPGNVGAFYGVGSNPAGTKTGTAVSDAFQGHRMFVERMNSLPGGPNANMGSPGNVSGVYNNLNVSTDLQTTLFGTDGTNGVPRVADETRPRTWYGIWMIRMYGRVLNSSGLDAPALDLSAMDMLAVDLAAALSSELVVFNTPGAYTWSVPDILKSGKQKAKVIVTGGGAGGGYFGVGSRGGGGGGGGTAFKIVDLSGVSSVVITIGAGGASGSYGLNGSAGGASSFGTYCSATGGGPGASQPNTPVGGGAGTGVGGDLNVHGSDGEDGHGGSLNELSGMGNGGASYWGGAGKGGSPSGGSGFNGGGAGGSGNPAGTPNIAVGGDGMVLIQW